MPKSKPICFISYSHEDIDRDTLDYFKFLLERHSDNSFRVLLDDDLPYGSDINSFMGLLNKDVDAVIILFTPSYKQKITNRTGGVYTEFKTIMNRYEQTEQQKRRGVKSGDIEGYFALFPVLFSGTGVTAIPDEIRSIKYIDLSRLRAARNRRGRAVVPAKVEKEFIPEILKIISSLSVITVLKSKSFDNLYDTYYPRLFVELKADWANPRDIHHNYIESLFVKTNAFMKVQSQAVYFIIGRKGSGKTTIRDLLAVRNKEKFIDHLAIVADNFRLDALYSLFEATRVKYDTGNIFPRLDCFSLAWEAFIILCGMESLYTIRKSSQLTSYQKRHLTPIIKFLDELSANASPGRSLDRNATFIYCFNRVIEFIEYCIEGARTDDKYFYSDVQARFSRLHFLPFAFGTEALDSFQLIMQTMRKRFLISLDGFDSAFDVFRRRTVHMQSDLKERAQFEIDWLRSLVQLILSLKQGTNKLSDFAAQSDFCITVPHDRFYEVAFSERDSYRYQNRFLSLRWSGIELAILIRKRLDELVQFSSDRKLPPEDRLGQVLSRSFKHIPLDITFDFNGREYEMPLFMYVLRHTFWRPRDVLLYYAAILAVCHALKKGGEKIDTEVLRRIIKDVTRDVIRTEFINEFDTTVVNIAEVIDAFTRQRQVLPYNSLVSILNKLDFKFASGENLSANIDEKIEFLYRIGFLGVLAEKEMMIRLGLRTNHAFYFNEGDTPLNTIGNEGFRKYQFIIHPIFSEYLALDTTQNELIMNYSWKYLHEMEAISFS